MEFTTHLELQSQTTRLFGCLPYAPGTMAKDGILTLYDAMFQKTCAIVPKSDRLLQTTTRTAKQPDLKFELFPLHSPLLGESLLVSFPPLIDMLKFSGYSCLIWGPEDNFSRRKSGIGAGVFATPIAQHISSQQMSVYYTRIEKKRPALFIVHYQKLPFLESSSTCACCALHATCTLFVKWCPQTDMPSERRRNLRSKIRWFTKFCNSHYLSHFAAFFIDARAKRSVVESFKVYV